MKKLLQVLATAVVGAVLMGGVAGATSNNCNIYQAGSTSYNSCLNNLTKTTVQVTCENNVYVINNDSQQAGTGGSVTFNGNSASGSATNTNGSTVTIGANCGQATTPAASSSSSSSSNSPSSSSSSAAKTSVSASSLPETGSNTVVNGAVVASIAMIGVLGISYAAGVLYRRLATKE